MKLNSMAEQLAAWKKAHAPPPPVPEPSPKHPEKLSPRALAGRPEDRIVAGGIIQWVPVDRVAARLFYRAGWLEQPPPEVPKPVPAPDPVKKPDPAPNPPSPPQRHNKHNRKNKQMNSNGGIDKARVGNEDYMSYPDLVTKILEEIRRSPTQQTELARAALDARTVMDENMKGLGGLFEDFEFKVKNYLESLRQTRYAVLGDLTTITVAVKDVRQFFLGPNYQEEIKRLKEFVELCERLKALKESGFLDTVANTMLTLAVGPSQTSTRVMGGGAA